MIVFGCAVTDLETYETYAHPAVLRHGEPDSELLAHQSTGSLMRNYNLLLDEAQKRDDLDALVLLHQDAEIVDPDFCSKVRAALADPDVAIVGCAGAIGVRSIAWWEGAVTWASFTHRYEEWGGGDFPAMSWKREETPTFAYTGEVDAIDGFVMAVSPWAVENLRFDESLGKIHGYDFDFCCQARAAGKKVVTADLKVVHHHNLILIRNPEAWMEAHMRTAEKWESLLSPASSDGAVDWKLRARRAEADAAAAKGEAVSAQLQFEALAREYRRLIESSSWRITEPLRKLKALLKGGRPG
jgi:Glycosyltransferase like family